MQVKEIIKILKEEYEPDDFLVIGWYDYDEFEGIVKKELWGEVVDLADGEVDYDAILNTIHQVEEYNKE